VSAIFYVTFSLISTKGITNIKIGFRAVSDKRNDVLLEVGASVPKHVVRMSTWRNFTVMDVCDRKAGDTLSSRHVSSCDVNACSWNVRGDLTLNSMAQIHTSVTLLTSRDLTWSPGRLTCQHASQISAVAHIS